MKVSMACLALVSCFGVGVCRAQTAASEANPAGITLFSQEDKIRNALNLSGTWQFRKDSAGVGEAERWFDGLRASRSVAVPGSWNEQFENTRDYGGLVWYEQMTYVPPDWRGQRIRLRVGLANYAAQVWANGRLIGRHDGGHLPFAFDITRAVRYVGPNRIAIQVENILKSSRVLTGGEGVQELRGGPVSSFPKANFEFCRSSVLNHAVWLTATPAESSLTDITVRTTLDQTTGVVNAYDEEYLNVADREGILVTDEIPSVELFVSDKPKFIVECRAICKPYINELVSRDKNHPSVILWSLANEPVVPKFDLSNVAGSQTNDLSTAFFADLHQTAKTLDPTCPTTVMGGPAGWLTIPDVASINCYWYTNTGNMAAGAKLLSRELDELYKTVQRLIVITGFGADAQAGLRSEPAKMFTEEYQTEFIRAYLDVAAAKDYVVGMHVWAFAGFKTSQGVIRFGGMNCKGVFRRDRRPKMAAHFLRSRWLLPTKPTSAARP